MNKPKLFLKILTYVLAFWMLSATAKANSDSCLSLIRNVENNSVSGKLYVGEENVYNPVTIRVTNENEDVIYLEQIYADDEGYATFKYIHNIQNAGTGIMTVMAYHNSNLYTETYKVVSADVVNLIVSAIQEECKKENPDYVAVKNAYLGEDSDENGTADNAEILSLDLALYNTLSNKDDVFEILADDPANDSVDSMEKAVQAFYDAVALAKIIDSDNISVITDLMSADLYSSVFKMDKLPVNADGNSVLIAANKTVQKKVYEAILKDKITEKNALSDKLVLYTLTKSLEYGAWQNTNALLNAYDEAGYLEIDFSVYNTLTNKTVVDKAMVKGFESYTEITEAFEDAVEDREKAEKNPTSASKPSSGGGGGGGGGGGFSVSIPSTIVGEKNDSTANANTNFNADANESNIISGNPSFEDMDEAKWAIEAVEALYKKGIINGTGEMNFEPNRGITRAEFVKMLVLTAGLSPISEDVFNDVYSQHWSYAYVAAAYKAGIVVGDDNKNFNGEKIINREEMAVMVHRLMNKLSIAPQKLETSDFDDADEISDWALESVNYLKSVEVVNGRSKNFFEPQATLTRAEAAVVIYKVLNKA